MFNLMGLEGEIEGATLEVEEMKSQKKQVLSSSSQRSGQHPSPGGLALCSLCHLQGPHLPVQVESCDLCVVSLKVYEIEEVLGRLLLSLLSGRKEGIMSWTQPSIGSPRKEPA